MVSDRKKYSTLKQFQRFIRPHAKDPAHPHYLHISGSPQADKTCMDYVMMGGGAPCTPDSG